MDFPLRYREERFTPAEAAQITGAPVHLQRDWRSQGMLPARTGGKATFAPRDLAKMRLMMALRNFGVPLDDAHRNAEAAAASVVYAAVRNEMERTVGVEGPDDLASAYREAIATSDIDHLAVLADMPELVELHRHAIIQNGHCDLVPAMEEHTMDETVEVAGVVNLYAVARAIGSLIPRPMFVLTVPRSYNVRR